MRVVYSYDRLHVTATKAGICTGCGKRARRQRTFEMTANPWNKNPDGSVRTDREIYAALQEKAAAWKAEPLLHPGCEPT